MQKKRDTAYSLLYSCYTHSQICCGDTQHIQFGHKDEERLCNIHRQHETKCSFINCLGISFILFSSVALGSLI